MGYYIFSFGIKKSEVLNIFGSKDEQIIKRVEQNEYFKDYYEDEEFTIKDALVDIINGEKIKEEYCYNYGYTIISICNEFGKTLPYEEEIKFGHQTQEIDICLSEDFGVENFCTDEIVFGNEDMIFYDIEPDDFPMIGLVTLEELKQIKSKLSNVVISDEDIEKLMDSGDDEKGYAYRNIKGIIENIDFCIENGLDLFSACH